MTCVSLKSRKEKIQKCEFTFCLTRHSLDLASEDSFTEEIVVGDGELGTNVSCRSISGFLFFLSSGILCEDLKRMADRYDKLSFSEGENLMNIESCSIIWISEMGFLMTYSVYCSCMI